MKRRRRSTNFNYTQAANKDWTDSEDAEALARHCISLNHLFGKDYKESTEAKGTAPTEQGAEGTKIDESATVDLTAAENSPDKKKSNRAEVPSYQVTRRQAAATPPVASAKQKLLTSTPTPVPLSL